MLLPQPAGLSPYCGLSMVAGSCALAQSQADFIETFPPLLAGGGGGSAAPAGVAPLRASIRHNAQGSKCAAPADTAFAGTADANTVFVAVLFSKVGAWNAPE